MSWHFSQALVAEYLGANSLDGEQYAPLKSNPTPQAYLCSDRMTAFSTRSLSGMTFAPLTEDLGAELLTWFRGAFPVRTSALQEKAKGLEESAADYGRKCGGSLARLCPNSFSWKTHQCLLFGGGKSYCRACLLGVCGAVGNFGSGSRQFGMRRRAILDCRYSDQRRNAGKRGRS